METLYYEFYYFMKFEGNIQISLKYTSEKSFKRYIKYLETLNSLSRYKLCEKSDNIIYYLFDYTFLKPEVLFRKDIIDYNIINIFDEEIKSLLNAWLNIISLDNIYYNRIKSSLNNMDKIILEAQIESIIK